jgi:hypothetical protein
MTWFEVVALFVSHGMDVSKSPITHRKWLTRVAEASVLNPRLSLLEHYLDPLNAFEVVIPRG